MGFHNESMEASTGVRNGCFVSIFHCLKLHTALPICNRKYVFKETLILINVNRKMFEQTYLQSPKMFILKVSARRSLKLYLFCLSVHAVQGPIYIVTGVFKLLKALG